jgi:hypothetical protein
MQNFHESQCHEGSKFLSSGSPTNPVQCKIYILVLNQRTLSCIKLNVLLQVCSHMNSYSDACMGLVSLNIDQIFNALEQSLQKDMCQPLGFCDESQLKVCTYFKDIVNGLQLCDNTMLFLYSRCAFLFVLCRMTENSNPDSKNHQR